MVIYGIWGLKKEFWNFFPKVSHPKVLSAEVWRSQSCAKVTNYYNYHTIIWKTKGQLLNHDDNRKLTVTGLLGIGKATWWPSWQGYQLSVSMNAGHDHREREKRVKVGGRYATFAWKDLSI